MLRTTVVLIACLFSSLAQAQPVAKSAIQVDPGNTKQTGQTFAYRLTYNCSNTSGPCLNAEVVDLLPAEVQFVSTVPASPTGDVAAINVTNNFMGTGRTRVQFVMINPLPAGNSGDLIVNVRFPAGSTPDGTMAVNTADGINLAATPGTTTTPPITVTAVATTQVNLTKTLTSSPANLDMPESYRLRIAVPNNAGALQLTSIGPVTDTLPPGTVFNGASPAADCEPACIGTTPASVAWTSPCSVPLNPNSNCDITVNVTFPSATFASGTNVTNSFVADATPLGEASSTFGPGTVMHTVTTFVPNPSANLQKNVASGSANPPTLNQTFSYDLVPSNNGNVVLDNMVIIDTLPVELDLTSVSTGSYSGLSDFAAGEGVRVSYEKNTALSVFTLWGSSPNTTTNTTLTVPPPGLVVGEYVTRIRWELGQAQPGMSPTTRPLITGMIINPDNAGGPVAFGDSIQNCVDLTSVYTAGPTNVNRNACRSFVLSGPFAQLNPAKENLSGGGPFNPGQTVSWRLRVRSASQSSDPLPLESVVATDLLPVDLLFTSWMFDDQNTGLPAPQSFEQIPNFAGSGRTLLRWRWNAGSGALDVGDQVWININTTIRNGVANGMLSNSVALEHDAPGLSQRCSGSSQADALDVDGDADTAETLCVATGNISVAGIAQVVSSKQIDAVCDGGFTSSSAGTLIGGDIQYRLRVTNLGTVPMQGFVLIDILPFVGDTGVRDTSPRASQWTPLLTGPITPPPGTVLSYSTSGNPCRGEVGGPTSSCDPPNWTTVPPDPISSVRSFKIEFGGVVVGPFDFLDFTFSMLAPGNVPPGTFAYNSFAYQTDRADGLGSLAAEPQKVGISLGDCEAASLGDFVWVDINRDGLQNDGPTGLNGVFTQLFSPGPDSIPGSNDDIPLAQTLTSDGPSGSGWYLFPGLAPGDYYVCFTPPPTFVVTPADQSTDQLDSDADVNTGCTPVVTLAPNEANLDVDAGLQATALAALGDYVWFDRDGNGVQNESVWDGINGVAVRLYVDNGDGTFNAGSDLQVATTVTANDVFNRPGYYLFDGLIPGLRYFVQFEQPASATGFTTMNVGSDATIDSDADPSTGASEAVILAPNEINRTIDAGVVLPTGTLSLGNQVWLDADNDGVFEPQDGETGIDGVRLLLYRDVNGDGLPSIDEYYGATATATSSGFAGRYRFDDLPAGTFIVVIDPFSFTGGQPLSNLVSSTGNDPAPDPDDDADGDDNGTDIGALTGSLPVSLSDNGEPTSEDGDNDSNLTVDFGFASTGTAPEFDYGDAPDIAAGTSSGDYNTTVLDNGAAHRQGVQGSPYLGSCVDGDGGFFQDVAALADDVNTFGTVTGTCTGDDDEDGVTFTGPFNAGLTARFTVTNGSPSSCVLNAWVDWNQSGVFGDSAGEQIATNVAVSAGPPTALLPNVPAGATPGVTYARFRCTSASGTGPTGTADDGEVEDYRVSVQGIDLGDAPNSYPTQGLGAARHTIDPLAALYLGGCVDLEADGQPNAAATGDDTAAGLATVGNCFDDEDGVAFNSPLAACQSSSVTVTASAAGRLDAWIDFSDDGDFNDPGERIFTNQLLAIGANPLSLTSPCTAVEGLTYARFRFSSAGSPSPAGEAADGEVEDYAVNVGNVDFGDAPDSYATLLASGGPNHRVISGFSLGATVDSEPQGQPNAGATGDGADEDGVTLPNMAMFVACSTVSVSVNLTNTASVATPRLDAWIDFDGDGSFDDPRDRIATSLALVSGANSVSVNVPCDTQSAIAYARFRLTSAGASTPGGPAEDGEVEDYQIAGKGLDFGDAPDPSYPTLQASNGARHVVMPTNNPVLGSVVDTEGDGQPNSGLSGDDGTMLDDEDGVTFPNGDLIPGAPGAIRVRTGAVGGDVSCWIDFNGNGSWSDSGDQVVSNLALAANTTSTQTFAVPVGSPQGTTASRCRISTATGLGVTGLAPDGEVEDHPAPIGVEMPNIMANKRLISSSRAPGNANKFSLEFELEIINTGNVPLSNISALAPFSMLFMPPSTFMVTSLTSDDFTVNPGFNGDSDPELLAPGQTLDIGASGTLRIQLMVNSSNPGPYNCSISVSGDSPAGNPVDDISNVVPFLLLQPAPAPVVDTWGLLVIVAIMLWLARRRLIPDRES